MQAMQMEKQNGIQYKYEDGSIFNMDCVDFLKSIGDETIDMVFADPPYNIKKAAWDDFENQEEYISWSLEWIKECARVLKHNGTLYICGFTENIADLKRPAMEFFEKCRWLIWHYDNKANLGKDWGRSHESILCLRKSNEYTFNIDDIRIPYNSHTLKYPERIQGESSQYNHSGTQKKEWSPNPLGAKPKDVIRIPTTCNGMSEKTKHPTQKPESLLRRLILASSNEGDVVVDPFSGSGTTAVVSRQLNRYFMVNDVSVEYNQWADKRLSTVVEKTKEEWIAFDRSNELRRGKIR